MVVLPVPGGPQSTTLGTERVRTASRRNEPGPRTDSCPTTSSRRVGSHALGQRHRPGARATALARCPGRRVCSCEGQRRRRFVRGGHSASSSLTTSSSNDRGSPRSGEPLMRIANARPRGVDRPAVARPSTVPASANTPERASVPVFARIALAPRDTAQALRERAVLARHRERLAQHRTAQDVAIERQEESRERAGGQAVLLREPRAVDDAQPGRQDPATHQRRRDGPLAARPAARPERLDARRP